MPSKSRNIMSLSAIFLILSLISSCSKGSVKLDSNVGRFVFLVVLLILIPLFLDGLTIDGSFYSSK